MDWINPWYLLLIFPIAAVLWWLMRGSLRPMSPVRQKALLAVRTLLVLIALLALAGPAWEQTTEEQAVIFILDHSQSQGKEGMLAARERVKQLAGELPSGTHIGYLSTGNSTRVLLSPTPNGELPEVEENWIGEDGGQTNLAGAVALARGLFPPGTARRIVLVTDGMETRGDLLASARVAALRDVVIDVVPVAGPQKPDVQAVALTSSKSRAHEGSTIELRAEIKSSLSGEGTLRLFENGIEVEARALTLENGQTISETFSRTPEERNLYTYLVRVEGFTGDTIPSNDEAMALVDVRGRPFLLYIEGQPDQSHHLAAAMAKEGIRLQVRSPEAFPRSMQELAGYDAVIVSDVPAQEFSRESMQLVQQYVENFGGGFVMIGGKHSFGVGGYYRTPIEDVLPVKMKAPDKEERISTALALVVDRSGSMRGEKIEICKSAAIATVDLLTNKDYVGVVAFDSSARWIVPMTQVTSKNAINSQIATLNSGGGTNVYPGMTSAREALLNVKAKIKHMIVMTDGQTGGSGYEELAAQLKAEGVTVSTVAIGTGSSNELLQKIAAAGGGQYYMTTDPANLPQIFTQDAMIHMGKLIREEAFSPQQVEPHVMLKGIPVEQAPQLLGYVKTNKKATAQIPWVTDLGDPLLAHWQYGTGKVTAFTSDCKSLWGALWLSTWSGYSQFWAQVLRETSRKPQGVNMDIRLAPQAEQIDVRVDLMEDPASYENNATVAADVYFVPAGVQGSGMELVKQIVLNQSGPGLYEGDFHPESPGVYLVRATSGGNMVSAGIVHQVSGETATGQINRTLLQAVADETRGALLESTEAPLSENSASHRELIELMPWLLRAFLLLFLVDVCIRRWENILGMVSLVRREA